MNIGNQIKQLRLKAGITQEALANDLGVTCQSVSKWENDVCAPDISLLPKISSFFGVTIDELFDLSLEQKLVRIENMIDFESELSDAKYRDAERLLLNILPDYDKKNPEQQPGRIESTLAHLYHHRIMSESKKVSDYARRAMRLHPDVKQDQWLLQDSERAAIGDWNCINHDKTISFYKELVRSYPEHSINYLHLIDNLIADHRTKEAKEYFKAYERLESKRDFHLLAYPIRIALADFDLEKANMLLAQAEESHPDNESLLFDLAGIHASICNYDKAISLYEKSYAIDKKPRYYDALQGIANIYEIQGKFEMALHTWGRIKDNLQEEWNLTEGAAIELADEEMQRLKKLI